MPATSNETRGRARALTRLVLSPRVVVPPGGLPPVVLGMALAHRDTGLWDWTVVALALVGTVGANTLAVAVNDVADEAADTENEGFAAGVSGGSRILQDGLVTAGGMRVALAVAAAGLCVVAVALVVLATWLILPLSAVGVGLALAYSTGPRLAHTRLGGLVVAVVSGMLYTEFGYAVLARRLGGGAALTGLAPTCLAAVTLLAAYTLDVAADMAIGKITLATHVSEKGRRTVVWLLVAGAAAVLVASVTTGGLPVPALVGLGGLGWVAFVTSGDPERLAWVAASANLGLCVTAATGAAVDVTSVPAWAQTAAAALVGGAVVAGWWLLAHRNVGALQGQLRQGT